MIIYIYIYILHYTLLYYYSGETVLEEDNICETTAATATAKQQLQNQISPDRCKSRRSPNICNNQTIPNRCKRQGVLAKAQEVLTRQNAQGVPTDVKAQEALTNTKAQGVLADAKAQEVRRNVTPKKS